MECECECAVYSIHIYIYITVYSIYMDIYISLFFFVKLYVFMCELSVYWRMTMVGMSVRV